VLRLQRASKHLWAPSSLGASAETSCCRRRSARRPTPAGSRCWGRYTLPFCPSKVCHLRPRRAVSAPGGVLGNLVDLNVSGRRARQERLPGLESTRKVLSLCPLTMAYSWSGALGPRVVPRAAHDVNSCLSRVFWCSLGSGWPGWGGSHACFAPYCAGDVVLETGCKVWAACERICGCEQHKRLGFVAPALAEQWRRAVSACV
jgi:hypothetical protein